MDYSRFQILFKVIVVPDPTDRRPEGKTKKNMKVIHILT